MITKNGERLTGFAGVRCVDLAVGFHPTISLLGRSYALCLRLRSGESITVAGMPWVSWWGRSTDDHNDYEGTAAILDGIAWQIGALMNVSVSKDEL